MCERSRTDSRPSPWVVRFLNGSAPGGRLLDVACGRGRLLRFGLMRGMRVTGVDRDLSTVRHLAGQSAVELLEADLEDGRTFPFRGRTFDAVIVTNYLWRPIFPDIVASVGDGGLLIYETFAHGNERYGRPFNPDHLLREGELLDVVRPSLRIVAYEHIKLSRPDRVVQRIAAVGVRHDWPLSDGLGSTSASSEL